MGSRVVKKPADIEEAIRDIVVSDIGDMLNLEELHAIISTMHRIEELMLGGILREIEMELIRQDEDILLMAEGVMNIVNSAYENLIIQRVFVASSDVKTDERGKFSMVITVRKGVTRV